MAREWEGEECRFETPIRVLIMFVSLATRNCFFCTMDVEELLLRECCTHGIMHLNQRTNLPHSLGS